MATRKVTFTLDEETAARIDRLAERFDMPKSRIVREAVAQFASDGSHGLMSEAESQLLLAAYDAYIERLPPRPPGAAEREIAEIRQARRSGGRLNGRGID